MNEMYPYLNRKARPNNNQLITYYKRVSYLQIIHTTHSRIYLNPLKRAIIKIHNIERNIFVEHNCIEHF